MLAVMRQERFQCLSPKGQYETILSHFVINEPAVADAIRYGLLWERHCRDCADGSYVVAYPEGHPKG